MSHMSGCLRTNKGTSDGPTDMSSSREADGTTYTTGDKRRWIYVSYTSDATLASHLTLEIKDSTGTWRTVARMGRKATAGGDAISVWGLIPPNTDYRVTSQNVSGGEVWNEGDLTG